MLFEGNLITHITFVIFCDLQNYLSSEETERCANMLFELVIYKNYINNVNNSELLRVIASDEITYFDMSSLSIHLSLKYFSPQRKINNSSLLT